tara:strand:- start:537 stop:713 length:177 start_codon:yes stop_codon:yes gene_type:complete
MANYNVAVHTESAKNMAALLALIETKLDAIDDGKTIRYLETYKDANQGGYSYALVIDA